ncbi:MAG: TMEM165/GDT1 family protein [Thermosynechococcaceae cyanobacterium]
MVHRTYQHELVTHPLADSEPSLEPLQGQGEASHPEQEKAHSQTQSTDAPKDFGREFLMAFGTIFLAELGDKTQLSTLLMTAESQSPWIVFAGAAAALITTSLLGVVIGRWLARYLSPEALKTATGASLLFIAVLLIWDTVHL